MECFIDYIGLSSCAGAYEAPASGIYINSLPGLNLKSIEKIATAEQVNYLGVWDDVQANAVAQFKVDVISEINKCYQLDCDCDYEALICENIKILTQSWKYVLGIWILLFRINSDNLNQYTTVTRDQAIELKDWYHAEYGRFLEASVKCMDISSCELCCGGNPSVIVWLP